MDKTDNIKYLIERNRDNPLLYEMLLSVFTNSYSVVFTVQISKAKLFRARINKNIINFEKVSEISYPLPKFVSSYGRVNRPFQNLFYASDSHETCEAELIPYLKSDKYTIGDIVPITIGLWELNAPVTVLVILDKTNERLTEFIEATKHFDIPSENQIFLDFINELYSKSHKDEKEIYKITSAFSNAAFNNFSFQNKHVEGIMYKSVQDFNGFNVALFPEVIDTRKLELKSIIKGYYKIGDTYTLNAISVVEAKDFSIELDTIIWN